MEELTKDEIEILIDWGLISKDCQTAEWHNKSWELLDKLIRIAARLEIQNN